jgi:hypothetical protein
VQAALRARPSQRRVHFVLADMLPQRIHRERPLAIIAGWLSVMRAAVGTDQAS